MGKTLQQRQRETGRTLGLNGAAWRRLRASVLANEPLCRLCKRMGRTALATDVDHWDNNPSNNDATNLVALCHECHSRKTQADMGKATGWGCDVHGYPLDPSDPWSNERDPVMSLIAKWKSRAAEGAESRGFPRFTVECLKNRQS